MNGSATRISAGHQAPDGDSISTREILLQGRVQGFGVRPSVARLAARLNLCGDVANTVDGVVIRIEGSVSAIAEFSDRLSAELPSAARCTLTSSMPLPFEGFVRFQICRLPSDCPAAVDIPADLAVCPSCLQEVCAKGNRRFSDPFASCTLCGPRYSIIRSLPWEREDTTMGAFPVCGTCLAEYRSANDRRFHAQTVTCPHCGPRLWFQSATDGFQTEAGDWTPAGQEAITAAAALIQRGGILAMKGLGGYQLLADATRDETIRRLRSAKHRSGKPFAVMVASPGELPSRISDSERDLLKSFASPIVIVPDDGSLKLASSVSQGLNTLGIMLPTTALHSLLLAQLPNAVVVTSGNSDSEPLVFTVREAMEDLRGIADGWLHHNREIERPIDDSVVRVIGDEAVTIRAARGIAPLRLPLTTSVPLLAVGGEQKVAVALANGRQVVLSPHLGDLHSVAARQRFIDQVASLQKLLRMEPQVIVHDLHPDYFTTRWAMSQDRPTIAVQHHHAHTVSAMLQHGLLQRKVLGVVFDGSGYGTDGTIWGGELLLATSKTFTRVASLLPFVLPGGEQAIREPWRIAVSLLMAAMPEIDAEQIGQLLEQRAEAGIRQGDDTDKLPSVHRIRSIQALMRSRTAAITTSMGRLFDGIASLILGIPCSRYEAELSGLLECVAQSVEIETAAGTCTHQPILLDQPQLQADWRPLVRDLMALMAARAPVPELAAMFHRWVADTTIRLAACFPVHPVVLSGGCFQNRLLTELIVTGMTRDSRIVAAPGMIPPNDGGLAAGQIAVASARLQSDSAKGVAACV